MPTDLDIIKQLEQSIGKKLPRLNGIIWDSVLLEIGQLQKLTRFSLHNNQFTQFIQVLLALNLKVKWDRKNWEDGLHIEGNPFQTPPEEIVKPGKQAIIDYYAALEKQLA